MISVSGKHWEEQNFNKRLTNKIKIENNFSEIVARQIISKNLIFNKNELNLIVQVVENLWKNKKKLQIVIIDIIITPDKG